MDTVIRPVTPDEYDALGELTARAFLDDGLLTFGGGARHLAELRDVAGRAAAAEVLVAADGARVLGGVTFVPSAGPMADIAGAREAELRVLAVDRAARRRGVGEALVRACVERARATPGRVRVVLSSQGATRGAHRLYERPGFARTPHRDRSPLPEPDDIRLITYALEL